MLSMILLLGMSTLYSSNNDLTVDTKELILIALSFDDSNPLHEPDSKEIYSGFVELLTTWGTGTGQVPINLSKYFGYLIENASQYYDDSFDLRRHKYRRAMAFASLALALDFEQGVTFLNYAKFSLIGSMEAPDIEFLENNMLGLMLVELLLVTNENEKETSRVLREIERFLEAHTNQLDKSLVESTIELLKKY